MNPKPKKLDPGNGVPWRVHGRRKLNTESLSQLSVNQFAPSFLLPQPTSHLSLQINTKPKARQKFTKETQVFSHLTPMATRKLIRDFCLSKRSLLLPSPHHHRHHLEVSFISQIHLSINCLFMYLSLLLFVAWIGLE